ncbi:MAG: M20/M25/M40 family metallo-hydrolase [Natronomonas sp.]|uniref:M20/M25/M40 family metallo-hydrolase n=1 Tax=Natronomonas sp. TaxID=2184060 RepID=UPI002870B1DA|nr:M20/M25/M40 family metallo-hydrolase [Natronomonas sp.]MDR9430675.1 M20/M25/M40 family metallo-hydrolase [Natronomonas sp.]
MDETQRSFLRDLLSVSTPSGFETVGQRRWLSYVSEYADETRTDAYGNAVAVHEGAPDGPSIAITGHGDEIGMMVRAITDDGFLQLSRIGGSDRTVTRGQHVTVHTDDGPVDGVIGQVAIHLRKSDDETYDEIAEQHVDIGVEEGDDARALVDVGDPVTLNTEITELTDGRLAARGMDNRVGTWTAAEAFRRAVETDPDATVYAISTVQEELGLRGAQMVGFELEPDAVVAVDVTHATDHPDSPSVRGSDVELGGGPVVARGSANHPVIVDAVRAVAADSEIDLQLAAAGTRTGTDADAFYTSRGGIPSLNLGIPNRYMHTPVEVVDRDDLDSAAALLAATAVRLDEFAPFGVDL